MKNFACKVGNILKSQRYLPAHTRTIHIHTHTRHTAQHSTVWCCRNNRRRRVFPARAPIAFATRITTESLRVRALAAAKRASTNAKSVSSGAERGAALAGEMNEWGGERWQDSPDHGGDSGLDLNRANNLDGKLFIISKVKRSFCASLFFPYRAILSDFGH